MASIIRLFTVIAALLACAYWQEYIYAWLMVGTEAVTDFFSCLVRAHPLLSDSIGSIRTGVEFFCNEAQEVLRVGFEKVCHLVYAAKGELPVVISDELSAMAETLQRASLALWDAGTTCVGVAQALHRLLLSAQKLLALVVDEKVAATSIMALRIILFFISYRVIATLLWPVTATLRGLGRLIAIIT